jgi:hypothetical protein
MRQKIHTCLLNSAKLAIVSPITDGIFAETLIVISGEVPTDSNWVVLSCSKKILAFRMQTVALKCVDVRCYQFE